MNVFQCNVFQQNVFQNDCAAPVVETINAGLLLDPPPGWTAVGTFARSGPINPPVTSIDFNRDDPDELWLLGLTDLETN